MLPASVKASAQSYLSGLGSLTEMLSGVSGYSDLLSMVPQLEPLVSQVQSASQALSSLSPEMQSNVTEAFGPQLSETNSMFQNQLSSLRDRVDLPESVENMLTGINLFG